MVLPRRETGLLLPTDLRGRETALEWLLRQVGGLSLMIRQNYHFVQYAPERIPHAIEHDIEETNRLYGVLDRRLAGHEFIAGEAFMIADIAAYLWIVGWKGQQQDVESPLNLSRWLDAIRQRPGMLPSLP